MAKKQKQVMLLTGATGFVGSAVLRRIIEDGNVPIVLKRPSSNLCRIKDLSGYSSFTYENLKSEALIKEVSALKPDIFMNFAWRGVSGSARNEDYQIAENGPFVMETVDFAYHVGCKQWLGMGSQAEYGHPNRSVDETFPLEPTTSYGKAKADACLSALEACKSYGMIGSWIRLFDVYGPRDNNCWFIPYLIKEFSEGRSPKLTKCEQLWDFLYIDDAAKGVVSIADNNAEGIFNLGSGKSVKLKEVVELIREMIAPEIHPDYDSVDYRPDQVMHVEADISKIKRVAGWMPEVDVYSGIEKTINWSSGHGTRNDND